MLLPFMQMLSGHAQMRRLGSALACHAPNCTLEPPACCAFTAKRLLAPLAPAGRSRASIMQPGAGRPAL